MMHWHVLEDMVLEAWCSQT